jgi:riboflavin kinase/FMN adenylyltransferase
MERVRLDAPRPAGSRSAAATIGNFDGVHLGHQALVARTVAAARRHGASATVLTFDPHPARLLSPERAPAALMTADQKAEMLEALHVDRLVVLAFTPELARSSPEEFARDVLATALGARHVVVGSDFRFGRERSGDVAALEAAGAALGFAVEPVAPVRAAGGPVSSSRIREAVAAGDVVQAAALLGRPFFVDGHVVEGDRRGRQIGVPTANLEVVNEVLPARGVYAGFARTADGRRHRAVANLGLRPTFAGADLRLEVHLLGFAGDLYGSLLRVEFTERLREERRFESVDALVRQLREDVEHARRSRIGVEGNGI